MNKGYLYEIFKRYFPKKKSIIGVLNIIKEEKSIWILKFGGHIGKHFVK